MTPGPLTTSSAVKQAMLVDYGSRDARFLEVMHQVRTKLLGAANVSKEEGYECVIMQGAGTYGIEAVLGSVIPRDGRALILSNGAYGKRQQQICTILGIPFEAVDYGDHEVVRVEDMLKKLKEAGPGHFTHVSMIHHETTAGILNPLKEIGLALKESYPSVRLIVDSMSGFGAYPAQMKAWNLSYLVSSANKNLEGVPGFCFAICERAALEEAEKTNGGPRSLSLDLVGQWRNMEATAQFRFTPPTHSILAFHQAILEWEAEGGCAGRGARYKANYETVLKGMEEMGFKCYVAAEHRGHIITTFLQPEHPKWDFDAFYKALSDQGYVIYPGKLASAPSFRFGTIGRLYPKDFENLLLIVRQCVQRMGIELPLRE